MPTISAIRRAGESHFHVPAGGGLVNGDVTLKLAGTTSAAFTIDASGAAITLNTPLTVDTLVEITYADRRIERTVGANQVQPPATPAIVSYTNGTHTVAGTALPNQIVQVFVDGVAQAGFAVADGTGAWSFVIASTAGTRAITAVGYHVTTSRPTVATSVTYS